MSTMRIGAAGGSLTLVVACVALGAGCLGIAGLDEDYRLGNPAAGGQAVGGSTTGGGGATTTSSSGAGGLGGGGSSPTGGGGTGATGPEDCLNGMDDDGDDLVDCADVDDCPSADFGCVPALGSGSYVSVPDTPGSCAPTTDAITLSECSGCSCAAGAGSCSFELIFFSDDGCQSQTSSFNQPEPCIDASNNPVRWGTLVTSLGNPPQCMATGASVVPGTIPGCSLSQAGSCQDGSACVPRSPSQSRHCVLVAGAGSCPAGYDVERTVYVDPVSQCDCACSVESTQCDPAAVTSYNEHDWCGGGQTMSIQANAGCQAAGVVRSFTMPAVTSSASCAADATPSPPTSPHTLCCMP